MRTLQQENQIVVNHTKDGGIIAELNYVINGQILVVLSGGNWEYKKTEKGILEAEMLEVEEVIQDSREKGVNVDHSNIIIKRVYK